MSVQRAQSCPDVTLGKAGQWAFHRRSERGLLCGFEGLQQSRGSQLLQRSTRCRMAPESSNVDSCVGERDFHAAHRSCFSLPFIATQRNVLAYKNSWKWPARAWTVLTDEKSVTRTDCKLFPRLHCLSQWCWMKANMQSAELFARNGPWKVRTKKRVLEETDTKVDVETARSWKSTRACLVS